METENLAETLQLERIEMNLFRGVSWDKTRFRIFGGQVIGQALMAAYETVEDRLCHSLHCYFIHPGDASVPILFEVDRSRDGGSMSTRRVTAIQHGKQIFNLAASFMRQEDGLEHQTPMPAAPTWESLEDGLQGSLNLTPIEVRQTDPGGPRADEVRDPRSQTWLRARDPIGLDPRLQQAVMAYGSDMSLLSTAIRPHPINWQTPGLQFATLDHAMWFHKPINFNDWHLFDQDSPSASGGRALVRGSIFSADGTLVASVAQEGLMRLRPPR